MSGLSEDDFHEMRMNSGQASMTLSDAIENGGADLIPPVIESVKALKDHLEEQDCEHSLVTGTVIGLVLNILYDTEPE